MPNLPPDVEAHAQRLRCTTLRYVNLASRAQPPADWHWIYVPERKYPFYRVNVFSGHADDGAPGRGSICVEMSDRGPTSDEALRDLILALTAAGALSSPDDVVFAERKEIQYAYVVFDDNYYAATQRSSPFSRRTASTRAAATARGPTTPWKTACWPAVRSRASSTVSPRRRRLHERRTHPRIDRHPDLQRRRHPARLGAGAPEKLGRLGWRYELLLCENGSRDGTIEIGKALEIEHPEVRLLHAGQPNYGMAMKMGILEARGTYVICDEIVLLDTEFYARAMALLEAGHRDGRRVEGHGGLSGPAAAVPPPRDARLQRHAARDLPLRRHGHARPQGLPALVAVETARRCVLDRDVFASEFVIRAHREGKKVVEIPFAVREKRPPSINLTRRVPHVIKSVARLAISVRRNQDGPQ